MVVDHTDDIYYMNTIESMRYTMDMTIEEYLEFIRHLMEQAEAGGFSFD